MIGFCFSGEGSRGAIQAGIALSLFKKGIKADYVMGTSSGAACASAYAFVGPEGLADMWSKVRWMTDLFGINWNFLWNRGFFNAKPAAKLINKFVQEGPYCSGMVCRLNIESGDVEYVKSKEVTREEFAEATLGAFAIPGFVTDRNGWVDAGAREMAPLQQCIDEGCDEIYVILGRPLVALAWKLPSSFLCCLAMGWRAVDLSLFELLVRDVKNCIRKNMLEDKKKITIHVIEPNEILYNSCIFHPCPKGVQYGLDEKNYCIRDEHNLRLAFAPT